MQQVIEAIASITDADFNPGCVLWLRHPYHSALYIERTSDHEVRVTASAEPLPKKLKLPLDPADYVPGDSATFFVTPDGWVLRLMIWHDQPYVTARLGEDGSIHTSASLLAYLTAVIERWAAALVNSGYLAVAADPRLSLVSQVVRQEEAASG